MATATPPKSVFPRPPLIHDHAALFQEPTYEDGQPYADQNDDTEPDE